MKEKLYATIVKSLNYTQIHTHKNLSFVTRYESDPSQTY